MRPVGWLTGVWTSSESLNTELFIGSFKLQRRIFSVYIYVVITVYMDGREGEFLTLAVSFNYTV